MVAETVNAEATFVLVTEGAKEVMLNAAGELTEVEPQSAVHVEPIVTQTFCAPSDVGVTV